MLSSPRTGQHNADLLLRRKLPTGGAADLLNNLPGSFTGPDFCHICTPSMATMGQKSSLPQPAPSVSQVLMPDTECVVRPLPALGLCGVASRADLAADEFY